MPLNRPVLWLIKPIGQHRAFNDLIQIRQYITERVACCHCYAVEPDVVWVEMPPSIMFYEVTHGSKWVDCQRLEIVQPLPSQVFISSGCNMSSMRRHTHTHSWTLVLVHSGVCLVAQGWRLLTDRRQERLREWQGRDSLLLGLVCLNRYGDTWAWMKASESVSECLICGLHMFTLLLIHRVENSWLWQKID